MDAMIHADFGHRSAHESLIAFAGLPLDHLLLTGASAAGHKVMAAAAPNLTPLTLELDGKSLAIVPADFPPGVAAARIVSGILQHTLAGGGAVNDTLWHLGVHGLPFGVPAAWARSMAAPASTPSARRCLSSGRRAGRKATGSRRRTAARSTG